MGEGTPRRAGPRKLKLGCGGVGEGQAGRPSVPLSQLCWDPQSPSASTAQDSVGAGVGVLVQVSKMHTPVSGQAELEVLHS